MYQRRRTTSRSHQSVRGIIFFCTYGIYVTSKYGTRSGTILMKKSIDAQD
jgi:hypothetical protein